MRNKTSPWTDNALRAPHVAVSMTILGIGAALLLFIAYGGYMMNRAALSAQERMIQSALTVKVARTLMEQKAFFYWDQAARAAEGKHFDQHWYDREIGTFLTEGYHHDQIFILDPNDRFIYGYGQQSRLSASALLPLWPKIRPMLQQMRSPKPLVPSIRERAFALDQMRDQRLKSDNLGRWTARVLQGPDGPVVISLMTIIPVGDDNLKLRRPFIAASIVKLDKSWFDLVGKTLQLNGLRLAPRGERAGDSVPFVTDDGAVAARLHWEIAKPGTMAYAILPFFAVLLIVATLYTRSIFRNLAAAQQLLREQEANARFMAMHDGLSQLPNRRHFSQSLRTKLTENVAGLHIERICVAYLDVDRFKDVNDAIGHGAGDSLVMQIGPRLIAALRPDDLLARLGGDEFAVMRVLGADEHPEDLGRAIQSAFQRSFAVGNQLLEITASIDIAVAEQGDPDPDRVVQDADISLYRAKDQGRNQYVVFHADMAEEVRVRHSLENDLRAAIGTEQIVMHYQPIISARTGEIRSVEALVRWAHPERGLIPPDRFISLAERSGLMVPLGDYILETVLREAHRFDDLSIAINLSPVQLRQRSLPQRIALLCRRFDVDPARITLEVTEGMLIESSGVCGEVFRALCDMGFKTALDDFGTGYSSLGYLHRFRFDKIKIDRSFISSGSLAQMRPIVEAIVHIGRGLRMEIVAEGVESAAEMAMVQALGCTEAQGYGISRPMPIDDILAYIEASEKTLPRRSAPVYLAHG